MHHHEKQHKLYRPLARVWPHRTKPDLSGFQLPTAVQLSDEMTEAFLNHAENIIDVKLLLAPFCTDIQPVTGYGSLREPSEFPEKPL